MTTHNMIVDTPIGPVRIQGTDRAVTHLTFVTPDTAPDGRRPPCGKPVAEAARQLEAYFADRREAFDLPLAPEGTAFQKRVWHALCQIPSQQTRSYGDIAKTLGQPGASRAVGLANARNPIAVIIPCHRVIGAGGNLTGYAGGVTRKIWLLTHEGHRLDTSRQRLAR